MLLGACSLIGLARASEQDGWPSPESLHAAPSTDTSIVETKIGSVTYRIPRNYILYPNLGYPVLKVTFPGFEPLTEETRDCFDPKLQLAQNACTTLELRLHGGIGPDGLPFSNAKRFGNVLRNWMNFDPRPVKRVGPFGYDLYEVGRDSSQAEHYRKEAGDVYFYCMIGESTFESGVCNDTIFLEDGNSVAFFFQYDQIKNVEQIETDIRKLMASFVTREIGK